jgi:hypothetical protein
MDKKKYIPIIHARIHKKIKEKSNGNIIQYGKLKEIVGRTIVKKGGIPRSDIHSTIIDLINLNLLLRLKQRTFQIISYSDKRLKEDII